MILLFNIEYRTNWGEEVRVSGSIPELGNEHPDKALPLQTIDGIHWTAEVNIAMPEDGLVRYSYHIFRDGRHTRAEWNSLPRTLYLCQGRPCLLVQRLPGGQDVLRQDR